MFFHAVAQLIVGEAKALGGGALVVAIAFERGADDGGFIGVDRGLEVADAVTGRR